MTKKDEQKVKSNASIRSLIIGAPTDFQHRYHMIVNKSESTISGVPPQWRKRVAQGIDDANSLPHAKSEFSISDKQDVDMQLISCRRARLNYIESGGGFLSDIPYIQQFSEDTVESLIKDKPSFISEKASISVSHGIFTFYCPFEVDLLEPNSKKALVAVKKVKLSKYLSKMQLNTELKFYTKNKHENIVDFFNAWLWEDDLYIVFKDDMEITLAELISSMFMNVNALLGEKRFKANNISYFCDGIAKGLDYIHSKKYIHRDIKSDNILISSSGTVRIADFGVCYECQGSELVTNGELVGSPYWMAPEMIQRQPYSYEIDIWSLGCVILELVDGVPPYFEYETTEAMEAIIKEVTIIPSYINSFGPLIKPFLECCFSRKRSQRAAASMLLIHPFLSNKCNCSEIVALISDASLKNNLG